MRKQKSLDCFFKKKDIQLNEDDSLLDFNIKILELEGRLSKSPRIEHSHDQSFKEFDIACLERDPGLHLQM